MGMVAMGVVVMDVIVMSVVSGCDRMVIVLEGQT